MSRASTTFTADGRAGRGAQRVNHSVSVDVATSTGHQALRHCTAHTRSNAAPAQATGSRNKRTNQTPRVPESKRCRLRVEKSGDRQGSQRSHASPSMTGRSMGRGLRSIPRKGKRSRRQSRQPSHFSEGNAAPPPVLLSIIRSLAPCNVHLLKRKKESGPDNPAFLLCSTIPEMISTCTWSRTRSRRHPRRHPRRPAPASCCRCRVGANSTDSWYRCHRSRQSPAAPSHASRSPRSRSTSRGNCHRPQLWPRAVAHFHADVGATRRNIHDHSPTDR